MTCEKCGREIPEGQRFCGFCGASAEVKTIILPIEERTKIITRLRQADEICIKAHEHLRLGKEILHRAEEYASKIPGRIKTSLILIGIAILAACISRKVKYFLLGYSPIIVIFLVLGYFIFFSYPKRKRKELTELGKREQTLGSKILSDNAEALSVLPYEYWYPMATEYIARLFETNRVDSIREALKMFDEQRHRWMMEKSQEKILAAQQEQISLLNEVKSDISSLRSDVNYLVWSDILDF